MFRRKKKEPKSNIKTESKNLQETNDTIQFVDADKKPLAQEVILKEASDDATIEIKASSTEDKSTEVKPTEVTSTEVKPTEVTPTEVTPTEVKPTEVTPTEVKPIEVKATEVTPTEVTPTEVIPIEVKPTDDKPTDDKPTDDKPSEDKPTEVTPTEVTPTEVTSTEVSPDVVSTYDIKYDTFSKKEENDKILDELIDADRSQFKVDSNYLMHLSTSFEKKLEFYKRYIKNSYFSSYCLNLISHIDFRNIVSQIISNESLYLDNLYKYSVLKYRFCNYLGFNDLILDMFFDKGFSSYDNLNSDFSTEIIEDNNSIFIDVDKNTYQLREIIIVNSKTDPTLKDLLEKVKMLSKDGSIYKKIIDLIITVLGNENNYYKFNKFMNSKHHKQNINLGDIRYGLDRHKSILFKYLCDNIGINCCIVRKNVLEQDIIYEDHCWNIIVIDGQKIVIDFKNYPGRLIIPNNRFTIEYYQIDLI